MKKALSLFCFCLFGFMIFCLNSCKDKYSEGKNLVEVQAKQQIDTGDFDAAIKSYTEAIKLHEQDAYLYASRGRAKSEKGDIDGALEDFDQAIDIMLKELAKLYVGKASIYIQHKEYVRAEDEYKKALSFNPSLEEAKQYLEEGQKIREEEAKEQQENK